MAVVSTLLLFAGVYTLFLVFNYFQQLYRHRNKARSLCCQPAAQGNPGFYGIPGFMRIQKAAKEKRWIEYMTEDYGRYGTTFTQTILGKRIISTIEPENIKALLATQFNDFGLGTRHREFYPLLGDGIFTLDGEGWSHSRALLRPQFTRDQVADLDLMDGHISRLIDLVPKNGSSFDIQHLFFLLTIDSATHFLFGESIGALHTDSDASLLSKSSVGNAQGFAEAFNIAQDNLISRSRAVDFYWMVNGKEFREANKRVHEVVDYYVQLALESRRNPEKKQPGSRYIFAEALAAENDNPKVLRDNMLNILLAGRDTTASLLSSTFFYLARYPNVWSRLRQTIIEEFGDSQNPKGEITQTKLKDIPYLRYVLNEVLRLMPPVPVNFRVANKDTSLPVGGGPDKKSPIFIQKGALVAYNVYAMHRRTDFYGPDANTFRPERWEENARHGWEYLPFNGGPRICLGQQYALTEASYTLVKLLQRFDTIENADPGLIEPVKQANLTMSHDRGVNIRLYSSKLA